MARSGVYSRSSPAGNSGFTVVTVLNQGVYQYYLKFPSGKQIGPFDEPNQVKISDPGRQTTFLTIDNRVFPVLDSVDIKRLRNLNASTLAVEIKDAAKRTTDIIDYFYDPALTPEEEAAFAQYQRVDPDTGQIYYEAPMQDPKELNAVSVQLTQSPETERAVRQATISNQETELALIRAATGTSGVEYPSPPEVTNVREISLDELDPPAPVDEPEDITFDEDPSLYEDAEIPEGDLLSEPEDVTDEEFNAAFDEEFAEDELLTDPEAVTDEEFNAAFDEEFGDNIAPDGDFGDDEYLPDDIIEVQASASAQDEVNYKGYEDWRVRLALGPESNYLYNSSDPTSILYPLKETRGVIFPYTPTINVTYSANYNQIDLVHTNYKVNNYTSSSVDAVSITADFTAQDVREANYLLAVIHFFRSVTKMFYGQDSYPRAGTPPPLCFIYGMGNYQFSGQPLVVNSFNYNLPSDVDYIKTTSQSLGGEPQEITDYAPATASEARLGPDIAPGGQVPPPAFSSLADQVVSYVPTKIQLVIGCLPMLSRNMVSNNFSLEGYASGALYDGSRRRGGGFW